MSKERASHTEVEPEESAECVGSADREWFAVARILQLDKFDPGLKYESFRVEIGLGRAVRPGEDPEAVHGILRETAMDRLAEVERSIAKAFTKGGGRHG